MLNIKEWTMIRSLKNEGLTISEIARIARVDRKTARKYANSETPPKYTSNITKDSILDEYKPYIESRLEKYSLTSEKLFYEIKNQGYQGSYGTVNSFVKIIKKNLNTKAVLRFETLPGEQAQVDWGYFGKIYDHEKRKEIKLCCFLMILGFSRTRFIYFFDKDNTTNFLQGHNKAFEYFGGYTKEILYDNLKSVVIN